MEKDHAKNDRETAESYDHALAGRETVTWRKALTQIHVKEPASRLSAECAEGDSCNLPPVACLCKNATQDRPDRRGERPDTSYNALI